MSAHTNIALVDVDDDDVELGVFDGYDRDRHRALESEHAATHVFRRRQDTLECVRVDPDAPRLGDRFESRSARRLGGLLPTLVEEAVARFLRRSSAKISFRRRRPLQFVSLEPKNDVANALFGRRTHGRLPLRVRRGFALEARLVRLGDARRVGLVIDARAFSVIDATCADLVADGVDLAGLYVQAAADASEPWVEDRRRTVGSVERVVGRRIVLGTDRREDVTEVDLDSAWLDPSPAAIQRLLAHYVGPDAHDELWGERSELGSGPPRLQRIDDFRARLAQEEGLEIAPGVTCRVGGWLTAGRLGGSQVPRPRFIVGPGAGREVDATKGVFRAGPRQQPEAPRGKPIEACVICEQRLAKDAGEFVRELAEGLGAHRGLATTWRLPELRWRVFPAASADARAYEQACRDALDAAADYDVAFVQTPDRSRDLIGASNPYLVSKAKFLARAIPVQEFREETMRKSDNLRQWALGGIALQVFAKLGGIPWLLKAPPAPPWEVVLGLGSAQLGTGKFGARERVVGLATAFSGDGTYWLTEASRAVPYDEHERALGETAVAALRGARAQMAWRKGDAVRVVVHSFKDFRGAHADAIVDAVKELERDGHPVELALVHVAEMHPFLVFDDADANRIPTRGLAVPLGDREVLLTMLGPEEVRNEKLGFPSPLLLKVHPSSTYTDTRALAAQALAFAAHSWRNFSPTSLPVTILYADLIASLLGRLGNLPKWDPDVLRGDVGRMRWFL